MAALGLGVGLGQAAAPLINGFSALKAAILANAADVCILVIGDSVFNASDENFALFLNWLAPQHPEKSVYLHAFNSTTGDYDAPVTVQSGTGARAIRLYNASVAGTDPRYLLGTRWAKAVAAITPDLVIWGHGHNIDPSNTQVSLGIALAGIEMLKLAYPNAHTVICLEPPRRDDTVSDPMIQAFADAARSYGDSVIDFYTPFIALGKPSGLWADTIHPTAAAQTSVMLPVVQAAWRAARPARTAPHPAFLATRAQNLLNLDNSGVDQGYGYFAGYASGTPTGWTASSSPTLTRDTSIVDTEMGDTFSVKISSATGGARIERNLSTPALAALKAAGVGTLAVRKYVPSGAPASAGRISQNQSGTGEIDRTSAQSPNAQGRWVWELLPAHPVAGTLTFTAVQLYANTAAGAADVYYGRAILVAGALPRNDQSAP